MSTMINDEHIERFSAAIKAIADAKSEELLASTEARRLALIARAEERIAREIEYIREEHLADIRDAAAAERSSSVNELRQRLYAERHKYAENVFAEATLRIVAFTESEAYGNFLVALAQQTVQAYNIEDATLSLRACDMHFIAQLQQAGVHCAYAESFDITLGGFTLWLPQQRLLIDERLENRLWQQRGWFTANSGLSAAW